MHLKSNPLVIATLLIAPLLLAAVAGAGFRNYEKDPDLEAAFAFDSELNGGDRKIADRAKAEEHYLRFLSRSRDSAQRARTYVQLGVLYATNYHREKGEEPDFAKSVE